VSKKNRRHAHTPDFMPVPQAPIPLPPEKPKAVEVDVPKPRLRVDGPDWHSTTSGVLRRALSQHLEHDYTDVVVIGVRKDGVVETLAYAPSQDRYRLAGIVRFALDRFCRG